MAGRVRHDRHEQPCSTPVEERVVALEARLEELERRLTGTGRARGAQADATGDDPYYALHALQARVPAPGAVLYTGSVDVPAGHVEWQYALSTGALLDDDWAERVAPITALAHPARLRILQLILEGIDSAADLAETEELGSTGQIYHHLRQLTATGWLDSTGRGHYHVPPPRIVPLLTVLLATR